jgi:hypothetical protein
LGKPLSFLGKPLGFQGKPQRFSRKSSDFLIFHFHEFLARNNLNFLDLF